MALCEVFSFIVILELFNSEKKLSFIEAALDFLVVLAICLTLAAVIAFINYYSKNVLCGEWKSDFHSRFGT